MPRYFLHLRDHTEEILDPEGIAMPAEAVAGVALNSARDCIAGDVRDGRVDLRFRIDVHDESGALVRSQTFADAVEVIAP